MADDRSSGIHHITAIASNPQRTLDFYTQVIGLRLVKLTVNFDDPGTYHLSVSNSLSRRHWELHQVPAMGDPAHVVQLDVGDRVSAGEGQRRVALQ